MKKKFVISILAGVLLSVVTLYFALRNVSFDDVLQSILSIDPFWLLPIPLTIMISFLFRVIRWQLILRTSQNVPFFAAYHPLMIGFMLNCILPARAGEVARPMVLKQLGNVPFSTGLASIAAERFFDILVLLIFFAVMFQMVEIDPHIKIAFGKYHLNKSLLLSLGTGMVKLGIMIICIMALISSNKVRNIISSFLIVLPGFFIRENQSIKNKMEERICKPLIRIIDNIGYGFSVIKKPGEIALCFILSIMIWVFAGISYYLLSLGFSGISLNIMEIFIFMIIICMFIALPSAPGYWGLWEAGGVFALTIFGVSANEAASFTLANHVMQFLPVIIAGIISMIITGININQLGFKRHSVAHRNEN